MKKIKRSNCPINYALETFGDTWSLLIIRDILYYHKTTYAEFLNSDEGISTNILANRLVQLEVAGILTKSTNKNDKRRDQYALTKKGLDLYPIMLEMTLWSAKHDVNTVVPPIFVSLAKKDRKGLIKAVQKGDFQFPLIPMRG